MEAGGGGNNRHGSWGGDGQQDAASQRRGRSVYARAGGARAATAVFINVVARGCLIMVAKKEAATRRPQCKRLHLRVLDLFVVWDSTHGVPQLWARPDASYCDREPSVIGVMCDRGVRRGARARAGGPEACAAGLASTGHGPLEKLLGPGPPPCPPPPPFLSHASFKQFPTKLGQSPCSQRLLHPHSFQHPTPPRLVACARPGPGPAPHRPRPLGLVYALLNRSSNPQALLANSRLGLSLASTSLPLLRSSLNHHHYGARHGALSQDGPARPPGRRHH